MQADGTVDLGWTADTNGEVYALQADDSGHIFVAGQFNTIGGTNRNQIARLASNGDVDLNWNANLSSNGILRTLALDASGNLYVGGFITNIGGQARNNIAKLSGSTGAVDPNWNPGTDSWVQLLAVDNTNGLLYAGGQFNHAGGISLERLARFSTDGDGLVDSNWSPQPDGQISDVAVDSTGNVFVSGYFQNIGGQAREGIAKLTGADGSADATWNPDYPFLSGSRLLLDGTGALYTGGCKVRKLTPDGNGMDPMYSSWIAYDDCSINDMAMDTNGNVVVGGSFTTVDDQPRAGLAALPPTAPPIPSTERAALVALYNNTDGTNWTNKANWLGAIGTECAWYGVKCKSGHVDQINLVNNNLNGYLPSIDGLTELSRFDVEFNPMLSGSIPSIDTLSKLTFFDVGYNSLTGELPSLSGLSQLTVFGSADNHLTGNIPPLDGLSNLIYFWVDRNDLSGTIPDLSSLSSIQSFYINSNRISGEIPSAPSTLQPNFSGLCPNPLTQMPDPAWDAATGITPWYSLCTDEIFGNGFD